MPDRLFEGWKRERKMVEGRVFGLILACHVDLEGLAKLRDRVEALVPGMPETGVWPESDHARGR
jgi:hypothetical protein